MARQIRFTRVASQAWAFSFETEEGKSVGGFLSVHGVSEGANKNSVFRRVSVSFFCLAVYRSKEY